MKVRLRVLLAALTCALLAALVVVAAGGARSVDDVKSTQGFRKAVTLAGVREHQAAFQSFANANGGNRLATFGATMQVRSTSTTA